jgi:hypothetical protein
MRQGLRENALCASAAALCSAAIAWLGLYSFAWNDYETEARPAFDALVHGHVAQFLRLAPAYGGSLIERAPFALAAGLWGGGELAVYRMVALPCLLAAAALGVWLAARNRASGGTMLASAIAVGICAASPLALSALEEGHPEELLGGALCVGAVLLAADSSAGRQRSLWAGVLLGLAIANKEWAVLAIGPVLLAVAPGCRLRCLAATLLSAGVILAPLLIATSAGGVASSSTAHALASAGVFQPWQVWWFFGWHGALVHAPFGIPLHGYRTGPAWAATISHPLIVVVGFVLAGVLWLQRRRSTDVLTGRDALLLLALALLLRCMLDTWDIGYYMVPFMLALVAWELAGTSRRAPIITLTVVVLPWLALHRLSEQGISPDAQALIFLLWTVPLCAAIALALYAPAFAHRRLEGLQAPGATAPSAQSQETTVSAFGRPVSSS